MSVAVKSGTGAHPLPGPAAGVLNESGGCFQFLPPGGNPAGEEFGRGRNDKQVQDGGCHQPAELDDGQGAEQFASGLVNEVMMMGTTRSREPSRMASAGSIP